MDTIAVEQLKYIHNTLERMSVRQEETNRKLDILIEQGKSADIRKIAHDLYLLQEERKDK